MKNKLFPLLLLICLGNSLSSLRAVSLNEYEGEAEGKNSPTSIEDQKERADSDDCSSSTLARGEVLSARENTESNADNKITRSSYPWILLGKMSWRPFDSYGLHEMDDECITPPLKNFREHVANLENVGLYATTKGEEVIPIPNTVIAQLLHIRRGRDYAISAEQFRASLCKEYGKQIAAWAFSQAEQKNASVSHLDVLMQQGMAPIFKNLVHVINPFLTDIKIKVRVPEKETSEKAAAKASEQHPPFHVEKVSDSISSAIVDDNIQGHSLTAFFAAFMNSLDVRKQFSKKIIEPLITDALQHVGKTTPGVLNKTSFFSSS